MRNYSFKNRSESDFATREMARHRRLLEIIDEMESEKQKTTDSDKVSFITPVTPFHSLNK